MASVTVSVSWVVYGNGSNNTGTLPLTNATPPATPVQTLTTVNGGSGLTVTAPAGTVNGCLIVPPSGSAVSKTFKGVTGDVGIGGTYGNPASWVFISVTAGNAFNIAANGVETLTFIWS